MLVSSWSPILACRNSKNRNHLSNCITYHSNTNAIINCVCFVHAHTTAISIKCIYTVGGIIGSIRPFTKPIKKVDHRKIFFDQINAVLVNINFFQTYLQNKTTLQNQQNKKHSSNVEQCVCVYMCVFVWPGHVWDVCHDKEHLERICMIMLSPIHIWKITTQTPTTPTTLIQIHLLWQSKKKPG